MQNLYFQFGHSDWVWVDAEKVMKKSLLPLDTRSEKTQICIGNAKIKKTKQKIALFQIHNRTGLFSWKCKF